MDKLIPQYDKALGALDDFHNMATYIGDLRIIVIFITVTAYLGGIIFMIYKCATRKSSSSKRNSNSDGGASHKHHKQMKYMKEDSITDTIPRSGGQSPDFGRYTINATPPALVPYSKEDVKAKFMD